MQSLPVLDDLPPGFFVEETPRGILAVSIEVARVFHEARFGPDTDGPLQKSDLVGRRPLFELELGGERFVVRRFSHGGVLRFMTGERYLDAERPFRELILAHTVTGWGIATPAIVAARARRARGPGWVLETVTRRIEGAIDLGRVLGMMRTGPVPFVARKQLFSATGRFLREMHRHGLLHADLTPSNMLVQTAALRGEPPHLWILDLEGSQVRESLDFKHCRNNLRRMFRHVERLTQEGRARASRTDLLRLLRAYEPSRAHWKAYWRAIQRDHARTRGLHGAGWAIERAFSDRDRERRQMTGAGPTRG